MNRIAIAIGVLGAAVVVTPAPAAVTVYNSQANFSAAAGPTTSLNFDSGPTGVLPQTVGGVQISESAPISSQIASASFVTGKSLHWQSSITGSTMTFTFPSPITAFGATYYDVGTFVNGGTTLTALLSNGDSALLLGPNFTGSTGNAQFVGFTSTSGFSSVSFDKSQSFDFIEMDDVLYSATGTSTDVPEPTSLAVWGLISGIGIVGARFRRRLVRMS